MSKLLVSCIFILFSIHGSPANPLPAPPESKPSSSISGADIWSLIDRRFGTSDLIIPSLCPSPCPKLFRAQNVNVSGTECACKCSNGAPVFLQTSGQCVQRLGKLIDSDDGVVAKTPTGMSTDRIVFPSHNPNRTTIKVKCIISSKPNFRAKTHR